MKKTLSLVIMVLLFLSCGKKPEEEVREAIDVALTLLSENKCAEAIKLLEDVGMQENDPIYLQVLASSYACRAGFRTVAFIDSDLPLINPADLFRTLTLLSLSSQATVDSEAYLDLKRAITVLTTTDQQEVRNDKFGARKAGDMGVQLLLLSIVQLGKYLDFFGNVDAGGVKGAGPGASDCFMSYTYGPAVAAISSNTTGACDNPTEGHPAIAGADLRRRLCEGATTIANIIDVIKNIDLSGSPSLAVLESLTATVDAYRADADAAGIGHLIDLTSQSACETLLATPAEMNNMQLYFATGFEGGLL